MFRAVLTPVANATMTVARIPSPVFVRGVLKSKITVIPARNGIMDPISKAMSGMTRANRVCTIASSGKMRIIVRIKLRAITLGKGYFRVRMGRKSGMGTKSLLTSTSLRFVGRAKHGSVAPVIVNSDLRNGSLMYRRKRIRTKGAIVVRVGRGWRIEECYSEVNLT